MKEVAATSEAIRGAKLQSNRHQHHQHHHPTFFTDRMPFLLPNQQCQSTGGKKYHTPRTCSPKLTRGSSILVLTILHVTLEWIRVANPLFSPPTPVTHFPFVRK